MQNIANDFPPALGQRRATHGIEFRIFCDFAKYEVACAGFSELFFILDLNQKKVSQINLFMNNTPVKH